MSFTLGSLFYGRGTCESAVQTCIETGAQGRSAKRGDRVLSTIHALATPVREDDSFNRSWSSKRKKSEINF